MRYFRRFLAALMLVAPIGAVACSLVGLQMDVRFGRGSSTLDLEEAREFAEWFTEQRDIRPLMKIHIAGMFVANDKQFKALAEARVANIKRLVDSLNPEKISVKPFVGAGSENFPGPRDNLYDQVKVVVEPACTKTGTCCPQPIQQ